MKSDLYKDKDNVACKAMCGFPEILEDRDNLLPEQRTGILTIH